MFKSFHLSLILQEDRMRRVRQREIGLLGYGALFYEDMSKQPHATYFCYWYNVANGNFETMNDPTYYKYT